MEKQLVSDNLYKGGNRSIRPSRWRNTDFTYNIAVYNYNTEYKKGKLCEWYFR